MCTHPIEIERRDALTGRVRKDVVPCGKCSECRAAYQSEFACLCSIEADKKQSMAFITLTYNDTWLPVNRFRFMSDSNSDVVISLQRGSSCYDWQLTEWKDPFVGCGIQPDDDGDLVCPSLRRQDVKDWFKKFRSYCDRHDIPKGFSFACFGEYGEVKHRPHYHCLVAGISEDAARVLCNKWTFGFSDLKYIPRFNKDGTDAFVLTSKYVSKYICKRDKLPDFVQAGYAELPRRQTSIGFGSYSEEKLSELRNFI